MINRFVEGYSEKIRFFFFLMKKYIDKSLCNIWNIWCDTYQELPTADAIVCSIFRFRKTTKCQSVIVSLLIVAPSVTVPRWSASNVFFIYFFSFYRSLYDHSRELEHFEIFADQVIPGQWWWLRFSFFAKYLVTLSQWVLHRIDYGRIYCSQLVFFPFDRTDQLFSSDLEYNNGSHRTETVD